MALLKCYESRCILKLEIFLKNALKLFGKQPAIGHLGISNEIVCMLTDQGAAKRGQTSINILPCMHVEMFFIPSNLT